MIRGRQDVEIDVLMDTRKDAVKPPSSLSKLANCPKALLSNFK